MQVKFGHAAATVRTPAPVSSPPLQAPRFEGIGDLFCRRNRKTGDTSAFDLKAFLKTFDENTFLSQTKQTDDGARFTVGEVLLYLYGQRSECDGQEGRQDALGPRSDEYYSSRYFDKLLELGFGDTNPAQDEIMEGLLKMGVFTLPGNDREDKWTRARFSEKGVEMARQLFVETLQTAADPRDMAALTELVRRNPELLETVVDGEPLILHLLGAYRDLFPPSVHPPLR